MLKARIGDCCLDLESGIRRSADESQYVHFGKSSKIQIVPSLKQRAHVGVSPSQRTRLFRQAKQATADFNRASTGGMIGECMSCKADSMAAVGTESFPVGWLKYLSIEAAVGVGEHRSKS
jgi:hypothetical protein